MEKERGCVSFSDNSFALHFTSSFAHDWLYFLIFLLSRIRLLLSPLAMHRDAHIASHHRAECRKQKSVLRYPISPFSLSIHDVSVDVVSIPLQIFQPPIIAINAHGQVRPACALDAHIG